MCISIYRNVIVDSDSDSDSMIVSINYILPLYFTKSSFIY